MSPRNEFDNNERDERWVTMYDDEAIELLPGWTGGQNDPLYAISSSGGANYAWVFQDAIANLSSDIAKVKKLGKNKYQLGKGTFTKKEIDELNLIHDALMDTLNNPDSYAAPESVSEGRRATESRTVKANRTVKATKRLDPFTQQYAVTALWSSNDESDESGGEPLDNNYSINDIAPDTITKMAADCADFQKRFANLLTDSEIEAGKAGHDFWLSRNGHGAGFFDDDTIDKKFRDPLQNAARKYGEFNLYVGDDGLVYGDGSSYRETREGVSEGRRATESRTVKESIWRSSQVELYYFPGRKGLKPFYEVVGSDGGSQAVRNRDLGLEFAKLAQSYVDRGDRVSVAFDKARKELGYGKFTSFVQKVQETGAREVRARGVVPVLNAFRPSKRTTDDRKAAWMRAFQDAAEALGAPSGKLRWQDAEYLFRQGMDAKAAASKIYGARMEASERRSPIVKDTWVPPVLARDGITPIMLEILIHGMGEHANPKVPRSGDSLTYDRSGYKPLVDGGYITLKRGIPGLSSFGDYFVLTDKGSDVLNKYRVETRKITGNRK
jgi:hypothetical protein